MIQLGNPYVTVPTGPCPRRPLSPGEHVSGLRAGQFAAGDLQFQADEAVRLGERQADELADVIGRDGLEWPAGPDGVEESSLYKLLFELGNEVVLHEARRPDHRGGEPQLPDVVFDLPFGFKVGDA